MNKQAVGLIVALFLSFALAEGQSFDSLKADVEKCLRENDIPGAAVAVVTKDEVLFTAGFGFANLEKKIPITVDTHFWLGSISKSFTALGLVKLAEEGRLDLNTPLGKILTDLDLDYPWEET
ncbi:MAG: beta-lactamase family protein [Candidatus Aminicenantes bacterium]|nr:beta-lactamase family protein [Candidatus Aminicenantes bacterium]